jgi:hypothetical protein
MRFPARYLMTLLMMAIALSVQAGSQGQTPRFYVRFSKPLAVYSFVFNLSSKWGPLTVGGPNSFKALFQGSSYDQPKYRDLVDGFNKTTIAYDFIYPEYAGLDKGGLSTASLLWKEMANSQSIEDFTLRAIGIIPNPQLLKLSEVLTAFEPVYDELVYQPNKEVFEKQLRDLEDLIAKTDVGRYFEVGTKFYGSPWNSSVPVNFYFYPLSNSNGFTATVFFNNGISGIPSTLKDFKGLLSVMLHEIYHTLYDEQPLALKKDMYEWKKANPSKATHYAFTLLNESLATALANGYASGQMNGKLNQGNWYNRKYINLMAKKIYPLVTQYIESGKPMDKSFIDDYIKLFEDAFSDWLHDLDFVMEYRSAISDSRADFDVVDKKFPYNQTADYRTPFNENVLRGIAESPTTKILFISSDHKKHLDLVRSTFPELSGWEPDVMKDFAYSQMLNDKSYLVVINSVNTPVEKLIETLRLK